MATTVTEHLRFFYYDRVGNLTSVTMRNIAGVTDQNGVSTYHTYNARDQIVTLKNTCDACGWVVSQYDYTYDKNGYIASEKAVESLYGYAWDDKHGGKHEDGRHDDKHDKDGEYHFRLVETESSPTMKTAGSSLPKSGKKTAVSRLMNTPTTQSGTV